MGIPVFKPYENQKFMDLKKGSRFKIQAVEMTDLQCKWTHTNADGSECVCYGFLITHLEMGKMLYATDTAFIKWRFKGLNHILLGVNYDKSMIKDMDERKSHVLTGHMELQTAKDFIKSNLNEDLRNIILCHLSETNADKEHFINEIEKVANCPICVAHKGMEITLQNGECPF